MNNSNQMHEPKAATPYLARELGSLRSPLPPDDSSGRRIWMGSWSISKRLAWVFIVSAAIQIIVGTQISSFIKSTREALPAAQHGLSYRERRNHSGVAVS